MAEVRETTCAHCGGLNPQDARFCIECGTTLAPAALGPTIKLPTVRCPQCGVTNPEGAQYCVSCGGTMARRARPSTQHHHHNRWAAPRPATQPGTLRRQQHTFPTFEQLALVVIVGALLMAAVAKSTFPLFGALIALIVLSKSSPRSSGPLKLTPAIWWIGLGVLFMTGTFWPGILVLLAICWWAGTC